MWTAEVVYNYSQAGIPLETMWNDIDYMDLRRTWTVDPDRFPIEKMQEFITYLHDHDQHYMMMVDPPISVNDSASYNAAQEAGVILGYDNGTEFWATMWPGAVVFVDWLHPNSQSFWSNQIATFFSDTAGVAVDGMWIDMNDVTYFIVSPV
jgi:alpha-glucosidase